MAYEAEFKSIISFITSANNVLVIPHIDPDPDAIASAYAILMSCLRLGKRCKIGFQSELDSNNYYLLPNESYITYSEYSNPPYDLIICVDIGSSNRVGKYLSLIDDRITVINLDHHIDNDYFGTVNVVAMDYSSSSELVYDFLKVSGCDITKDIALALYTGIVYDTGSFRYDLTTKHTHEVVAEIMNYDIDTNSIYERLFESFTYAALRLNNRVAMTLELFCDGKVALTYLRQSFYSECGAGEEDRNSLVKIGASIRGVDFSIFVREVEDSLIKVSLRSKSDFKVNEVARCFGGGGHDKAAGFTLSASFDSARAIIVDEVIPRFRLKAH